MLIEILNDILGTEIDAEDISTNGGWFMAKGCDSINAKNRQPPYLVFGVQKPNKIE